MNKSNGRGVYNLTIEMFLDTFKNINTKWILISNFTLIIYKLL